MIYVWNQLTGQFADKNKYLFFIHMVIVNKIACMIVYVNITTKKITCFSTDNSIFLDKKTQA